MKKTSLWLGLGLLALLLPLSSQAEYSYFYTSTGASISGSDIIMKDVRWPYWNTAYYNTWINDNWTSSDGVSGYFYNGLALPAAGSPNPVTSQQTINWSFWPLSSPIKVSDTISSIYTSPNTFSMPTIGEGTIFRAPGKWTGWQTNVWYRMAIRTWQPVDGTAHQGFAGTWMRDGSSGVWYHMATIQLPFAVTGVTGSDGFQENAVGGNQPQRTDYRNCYYHRSGAWNAASRFQVYNHAGATENAGLIENNTAVYYETSENNTSYVGTITNVGQYSPTYTISGQPASPTFDPIIVANNSASLAGNQLLVQWSMASNSSPQFAYKIDVYTNASYTGNIATTYYAIAPDARQQLLSLGNVTNAYPQLTIVDIFGQTNAAINVIPTNATLQAATSAAGTVSGLNFAYYQSASNYTSDSNTNWSTMPNFGTLTPLSSGAVSGLDLTPRKRRNGYAFNFTGYLNVASNGLYAFTLNSCDGSKLYVDGQLVINFDGKHSPSDANGWIGLQSGFHTLNVQYFFDVQPTSLFSEYFDKLSLAYAGPGFGLTPVPTTAFFRTPALTYVEPIITLNSPTNGSTLSNMNVPLSATVITNGATNINKVQFYVGDYYWAQDLAAPYTTSSFFWANANNPIRARLTYNTTRVIDSSVNLVTTTNLNFAPWQYGQIFYHNKPSGGSIQNGTYSLIGDGVNLLTRQINGNCTLIAHLSGIASTATAPDGSAADGGWQAGIILRGTTNMIPGYPWGESGDAPFTAVFAQPNGGTYYQDESMVNGGGGYASGNLGGQKWFKLQRAGNVFTSSVSADGTTWKAVHTNTLTDFSSTIYVGFFTYAGPSSNPNIPWASFDNLSLTGNLVGPPGVVVSPATDTAFIGQSATLTASPTGNAPFTYQWQYNGNNLLNATNATLVLTNLQTANSGLYSVTLTNASGNATASATLTVLTPLPVTSQILSNQPTGYWRLNETAGPTAYDSAGNFNGTGEGGVTFGVPGVTNTPFSGFESNNLAALFNGSDADISIPGFNYTTTNFTITGWVRCDGAQTSWAGLVFSRGSGYGTGLELDNNGSNVELRYGWNDDGPDYNFSTKLFLPTNGLWAFVALTVEPTRAIVYMATNSVLQSATNNVTNSGRAMNGNFYFGYDPNSSSRRLVGALDEIAIYNRTLSSQQLTQIITAAGQVAPSINLLTPATGAGYASPATITLTATVNTNGQSISTLQFFNGTNLLGNADANGSFIWANVPTGQYTVFAQATYNGGNVISSTPALVSVNPIPLTPSAPIVAALASNLVSIVWSPVTYATSYQLLRNGTPIATLSGTNYLDSGLAANANYCYSIIAGNSYGNSAASDTTCVTTPTSGLALLWDAGSSTIGAQDGNGNWGTAAATWWNGSANVTWTDNALTIFGAGTATNFTVTITNTATPSGLIFNANSGGYTLTSGGSGQLVLSGTPAIVGNADVSLGAPLSSGGFVKSGPGTLTISGGNANTGAIIVGGGKVIGTGGGWYANRSIGSGALTVSNGAVAEFTQAHGFGVGTEGRPATLNGGTLQFDHENYVSSLTLTAGTVTGAGEVRTTGGTYSSLAATTPSFLNLPVNFVSSGVFNIARGTGPVDLLASGYAYGTDNFTKSGAGIMAISGAWTNTGVTLINGGQLQVDGWLGTNSVTVLNTATLSGNGSVGGATTVSSGGTLSPGDNTIGKLTISNKLTLNAGSKTVMKLSKSGSALTNDLVKGVTTLTYGGSLVVTNIGSTLFAPGDAFTLFSATSYGSSSFSSFTLPPLGTGLAWDTSKLLVTGSISVYTAVMPAITNTVVMNGGNFNLSGQGAAGQAYVLLMASNLVSPMVWTPMLTNMADTNGNFNFTDPQAGNSAQRFYRIQQGQ